MAHVCPLFTEPGEVNARGRTTGQVDFKSINKIETLVSGRNHISDSIEVR